MHHGTFDEYDNDDALHKWFVHIHFQAESMKADVMTGVLVETVTKYNIMT